MAEQNYLFVLANCKESWRFDDESSSQSHPGRFESLIKLIKFNQVLKSYWSCLRAYTARIREAGSDAEKEAIREDMRRRYKRTKQKFEVKKGLRSQNFSLQTKYYAAITKSPSSNAKGNPVGKPKWEVVSEDVDFGFHKRDSFQQVKRELCLFRGRSLVHL